MLVLEDGELLHVDSSKDILEHYGVKGMRWGKRLRTTATNVANYYDHTNRMNRKIDKNIAKRDRARQQLNSLNEEMSSRSKFRKLRGKTAAKYAIAYGAQNLGTTKSNVALGAAIGGGYGALMARKINREKRSKLTRELVDANANIARLEYKRDSRINKKEYKKDVKSIKAERKRNLSDVSNKEDRKIIKNAYSSGLRKRKREYKDKKYLTREKLDRFYDYGYINGSN